MVMSPGCPKCGFVHPEALDARELDVIVQPLREVFDRHLQGPVPLAEYVVELVTAGNQLFRLLETTVLNHNLWRGYAATADKTNEELRHRLLTLEQVGRELKARVDSWEARHPKLTDLRNVPVERFEYDHALSAEERARLEERVEERIDLKNRRGSD